MAGFVLRRPPPRPELEIEWETAAEERSNDEELEELSEQDEPSEEDEEELSEDEARPETPSGSTNGIG